MNDDNNSDEVFLTSNNNKNNNNNDIGCKGLMNGHKELENGQLALDRLLASLAVETDKMEKHSAQLNGHENAANESPISLVNGNSSPNNNNIFTFPSIRDNNFNNTIAQPSNGVHSNLNDVIANLTDFTRTETIRQMALTNGSGNCSPVIISTANQRYCLESTTTASTISSSTSSSTNNNSNINHIINNNGINNNNLVAIKRLASESENSSSISPSLSERSNGIVSWNDQVQCGFQISRLQLFQKKKRTPLLITF